MLLSVASGNRSSQVGPSQPFAVRACRSANLHRGLQENVLDGFACLHEYSKRRNKIDWSSELRRLPKAEIGVTQAFIDVAYTLASQYVLAFGWYDVASNLIPVVGTHDLAWAVLDTRFDIVAHKYHNQSDSLQVSMEQTILSPPGPHDDFALWPTVDRSHSHAIPPSQPEI